VQTATSVTGEHFVIPGLETPHVFSHRSKKIAATTKSKFLKNTRLTNGFLFNI
jgi:hypothetical protein